MSKFGYLVQVNLPVMVYVELEPDSDWPTEYENANRAAIQQVVNGVDAQAIEDARTRLAVDGIAYPNDFAEVVETVE